MEENFKSMNTANLDTAVYRLKNIRSKENLAFRIYKLKLQYAEYERSGLLPDKTFSINKFLNSLDKIPYLFNNINNNGNNNNNSKKNLSDIVNDAELNSNMQNSKRVKNLTNILTKKLKALKNLMNQELREDTIINISKSKSSSLIRENSNRDN